MRSIARETQLNVIRRERANGKADIETLWLRWTPGQARQDKPSWANVPYKPDFSELRENEATSVQKVTLKGFPFQSDFTAVLV